MKNNKLTDKMVEELNLLLKRENSCLRYIKSSSDGFTNNYRIAVVDKYIKIGENSYTIPSISKEFENLVREFFKNNFKVENTGYSNSVVTITTWDENYL